MRASTIKTEIRCIGASNLLIGGLALVLIALLIRLASPPPYTLYKILNMASFTPPVWVMVIAMSLYFFLGGAALFGALSCKYESVQKYKGSMFFIITASLSLGWYPVFFSLKMFLIALAMCIIACVCACLSASSYFKISRFLGSIMLICALWLAYLTFLNALCIFQKI